MAARRAGVVGAGTMGVGIAQALAQSGASVALVDVDLEAVGRARERIAAGLRKGAARGRWQSDAAEAALARISVSDDLASLQACDLVVEAVPERIRLKRDVLERIAAACGPDTVLATNTSSMLVSALAATTSVPERVVGMHFFNPAPLMALVEVVPGVRTSSGAVALAVATVEAMGKRPILAGDGIGFVVNRCARPFYGEALSLLAEGVATVEQIDRICRLGGRFRMGPFELIDLIGVDVNFEIATSFFEQSFGEPRWRPSPIQARLVAAGLHGRKVGRGFYDYDGAPRPADPSPPHRGGGDGRVVVIRGSGGLAVDLRDAAESAGFVVASQVVEPWLEIVADFETDDVGSPGPRVVLCARSGLARRRAGAAAGFHVVPPVGDATLAELTSTAQTDPEALERADGFFAALGLHREVVGDAPGLVLGRILAQLANEALFALTEDVASADHIDAGMMLGLNFPRGPIAAGRSIGAGHVRAVLDGLWEERRDGRYRSAPLLLQSAPFG